MSVAGHEYASPSKNLLPRARRRGPHGRGLTLVELVIVVAIASILMVIGMPIYQNHVRDLKINNAVLDIKRIETIIVRFQSNASRLPDSLAETGAAGMVDPWGNPYRYLRIQGAGLKGKGALRKDKNLVPVNSDYDLYSMGPDGNTKAPFTAKPARDDIVRCQNGGWVGVAEAY